MRLLLRFILVITIPAISFCTAAQNSDAVQRTEMRGVWIATVANIDWPSRPGLSSGQQKAEFDSLLNVLKSMNMNAVFVQVRPAGDALYKSKMAPMSASPAQTIPTTHKQAKRLSIVFSQKYF